MAQMYGVDVSEFQSVIDWDQLNAHAQFVIIRSSLGTLRTDYQFARNQVEARRVQAAAGPLGIGYYYYAYPTLLDPETSAAFFVDNLGQLEEGEVLVLDLEGNIGPDSVGWSLAFLNHVEALTTVKGLVYLNQSLISGHDWTPVINAGFGLWEAKYDGVKEAGPGPSPWPVTAMRQWESNDEVPGIPVQVDGDVFYGDINAWNAYGYHAPVVVLAPEPTPPPLPVPVASTPTVEIPPTTTIDSTSTPPIFVTTPVSGTATITGGSTLQQDERVVADWLGSVFGGFVLKLLGLGAGWALSHFGLVHLSDMLTTALGYLAASTVHDANI